LAVAILLAETLPLHHRRPAPGTVLVDIDVAVIARALVMLLEAIVVEIVPSASISSSAAAATEAAGWWWRRPWSGPSSSHALKSGTIPSFTTTTTTTAAAATGRCWRVVIVVQIARGRAIHDWAVEGGVSITTDVMK
jgi:hypothetical protein